MDFACIWERFPIEYSNNSHQLVSKYENSSINCKESYEKHPILRKISNLLVSGVTQNAAIATWKHYKYETVKLACYRARYGDLNLLNTRDQVEEHFKKYGRREGRSQSCEGLNINFVNKIIESFFVHGKYGKDDVEKKKFNRGVHNVVYGAVSQGSKCHREINMIDVHYQSTTMTARNMDDTIGLFRKMFFLYPNASNFVKIECETFIKDQHSLSMYLEQTLPDYWGNCGEKRLLDGEQFLYAKRGFYSISNFALQTFITKWGNNFRFKKTWSHISEEEKIGRFYNHFNIYLTCSQWEVSSYDFSSINVAYYPHLPICELHEEENVSFPQNIDIVITICRGSCSHVIRDVRWLLSRNVKVRIFAYHKCGWNFHCSSLAKFSDIYVETHVLKNVGRCDHTMSHFMFSHYKNFSDFVYFTKDTLSAWNFPRTSQHSLFYAASLYGFSCGTPLYQETTNVLRSFLPMRYSSPSVHENMSNDTTFRSMNLDSFLQEHEFDLRSKNVKSWTVCYGGIFVTKKERILHYSRSFYEKIKYTLSRGDNIIESHYMERMWAQMFAYSRMKCKSRCFICE